jgi:hypothetical protein
MEEQLEKIAKEYGLVFIDHNPDEFTCWAKHMDNEPQAWNCVEIIEALAKEMGLLKFWYDLPNCTVEEWLVVLDVAIEKEIIKKPARNKSQPA